MYLVVGLGNPGKIYQNTRHNVGFWVTEVVAKELGILELREKHQALCGKGQIDSHTVTVALPQTFMNLSGVAVHELCQWNKIPPEKTIVIYDDVDLPVGQIRIRLRGSSGGHKGVESIIQHLRSTDFRRVRVGIGREAVGEDVTEYVLQPIPKSDRPLLDEARERAVQAVLTIIREGPEAAMNKFNAA